MNILQLCHRVPFPPTDGGNIAMLNLSMSLVSNGNRVKIFALNTIKHFVNTPSLPDYFIKEMQLEAVTTDTSINPFSAFFNLFTGKSYNISRFYNKQFEKRLKQILNENNYDVIQLESLFMLPYLSCIRKNTKAKVALRAHNVEHIIWEQLQRSTKNRLKKWYLQLLAKRLKSYEVMHLNELDAILPITADDEAVFRNLGCKIPMLVTPLGINLKDYKTTTDKKTEWCLFHLGSMNWMPNQEGVNWFLEHCWTMIHDQFPDLNLYLAGRGFPKKLAEAGYHNVICEGEISDSTNYSVNKQIMIVPLLSGSGMRVKIIQGMALAKTIISTSIGAEGIQVTNGKNILIADTPQQFFDAVKKCMEDKYFAEQVGNAGRKLVAEKYSNEVIGKNVTGFYQRLITN